MIFKKSQECGRCDYRQDDILICRFVFQATVIFGLLQTKLISLNSIILLFYKTGIRLLWLLMK